MPAVASYEYVDENGLPVARIDRVEPGRDGKSKEFFPFLADGAGGFAERPGLNGIVLPLYRRDKVLSCTSAIIFLEGEGKCDVVNDGLRSAGSGAVATTIAGGASAALRPEHIADLTHVPAVFFISDSDAPGRAAAATRSQRVADANPTIDVRLLDLFPDASDGSDVQDWLSAGHTVTELRQLFKSARKVSVRETNALSAGAVDGQARHSNARNPLFGDVAELTEAFDDDSAFIEHLIEGLLPVAGSMVIGAKKKVGKSVLLVNLAKCVVRGEPFLGRACRQGPVLYGSFDEPKSVTLERLEAIGLRGQPDFFLWAKRGGFGDDWPIVVRAYIERFKPVLFIVDTLAKLAGIREINSYGEWNAAYAPLHAIADELGCGIAATVHNKKEGSGFDALAGSTAIGGGVDTIMVLERDLHNVRTIATEQRVGTDMERMILTMDADTFAVSIGPEQWLARQRQVQQEILEAIGGEELTLDEVLARVRHRALVVKRALYAAVDAGFIVRKGRGMRGDPRLYCQPDSGTKEPETLTNVRQFPGPEERVIRSVTDQETLRRTSSCDTSNKSGPGVDQAGLGGPTGPTGTNRDQETEEDDLLLAYASEAFDND